jgi:hypothetical protein
MANQIKGHKDKFLSDFVVAYRNEGYVGDIIAPSVNVQNSSDVYVVYDKENLRISDDSYVSGDSAKKVSRAWSEDSYRADERALEGDVSDKMLKNYDKPLTAEMETVTFLRDKQMLNKENRVARIVTDTAIVTQTSDADDWEGSGTPRKDIMAASKTIFEATGKYANTIILDYKVALAIASNSEFTGSYKSGNELVSMGGLPPVLWGLNVKIAGVLYASGDRVSASDPTIASLWNNCALVCYIDPSPSLYGLTFMKTFTPAGGAPSVIKGDYDRMKHAYSVQVYSECDEKVVCAECAYLFSDAG